MSPDGLIGAAVRQLQPSAVGAVASKFRPVLPNHLSHSCLVVPSAYMAAMALLTASQPLMSPFLSPTPYFSSVKEALAILKTPGSRAEKPARMVASVETASI